MDSPVQKNVAAVTGPVLLGIILNWYLYGLLSIQYILYLMHPRNDKMIIKFIVHLLFLLDTIQSILAMEDAFYWFAYNFGNTSKLYEFHACGFNIPALDAIVALIVQGVYCWRIWVLTQWKLIPIFTAMVALLAGTSGIAVGIRNIELGSILNLRESDVIPITLWLFGSAITDVIIAFLMTYILLRLKKEYAGRQTRARKLVRLLTLVLETNAITAVVAVETVVIFYIRSIAPPVTNIYQPGGYLLGKLYSNCFMVLLNQRHRYGTSNGTTTATVELGTLSNHPFQPGSVSSTTSGPAVKAVKLLNIEKTGKLEDTYTSMSDIAFADPPQEDQRLTNVK